MDIRLTCWEIGAAAALAPVVNALAARGDSIVAHTPGPARAVLAARCGPACAFEDLVPGDAAWDVTLAGLGNPANADAVATWAALNARAPSVCVLDQAKGSERFAALRNTGGPGLLPDRIAVMDDSVRDALIADAIAPHALSVTGNPALADTMACARDIRAAGPARRAALGIRPDAYVIVLAAEGLHSGHALTAPCDDGCTNLAGASLDCRDIFAALRADAEQDGHDNALVVLRPHPSRPDTHDDKLRTVTWDEADDHAILSIADRMCGISSMLLMQAALVGIETRNLAGRIAGWEPRSAFLEPAVWDTLRAAGLLGDVPPCDAAAARQAGAVDAVIALLDATAAQTAMQPAPARAAGQ